MKFQNFEVSAYQFLQMADEIVKLENNYLQEDVKCVHPEKIGQWKVYELSIRPAKIEVQTIKLQLYDIQENEYIWHPYRTPESIKEMMERVNSGGRIGNATQIKYPQNMTSAPFVTYSNPGPGNQIPPSQYPPSWQTTAPSFQTVAPSNQWNYNSGPWRPATNFFPDVFRIGLGFCWECKKAYYCYV